MRSLQYWHLFIMSHNLGVMYQKTGNKLMFPHGSLWLCHCGISWSYSLFFIKDETYDAANYRLVLLTCICCKTIEHILVSNINKHLALGSIVADCQHGFRSQKSCKTQLVQFVHDIIMQRHKQTNLIIMDFCKGFCQGSTQAAITQIRLLWDRGSTHKWISAHHSLGTLNK